MKTLILAALLATGCAPAAHRAATAPSLPRVAVASTLTADDPLEAPFCGLPTLPDFPCPTAPEPEHHHHHHHHHAEPVAADGGTP